MRTREWKTVIAQTMLDGSKWMKESRKTGKGVFVDAKGTERRIKNKRDLVAFLRAEIEMYEDMIENIEQKESA